jgi:hypothetical protein
LAKKRQKIRLVQQRKVSDMASLCRDLPDLIPMPLVIGTKVTARLRQPQVHFSFTAIYTIVIAFN